MNQHWGELAALATAFFWSWTAIFFTAAGKRLGAASVNILRLSGAVVILGVITAATQGASPGELYSGGKPLYLALSGLIGLALGDSALFHSMVLFGPRRATLVMACVPIITSFIAWPLLGETLSLTAWAGVFLTVGGVVWVVLEKSTKTSENVSLKAKQIRTGLFLGVVAALCQAVGLILAKAGMAGHVSPLPATLLRMIAGWAGMVVATTFTLNWSRVVQSLKDKTGMLLTASGTIVGPVLGVWLSLVAVRYAETGVAATLMGLVPIIVIPWVRIIYGERASPRALVGTVAAIAGTALLFSR